MLSSINFLFLLSLGFLSWTILCYIQQIEQFGYSNENIPQKFSKKENPVTVEVMNSEVQTLSPPSSNNYDIYIYLMGTLVCMYALVKITHMAEKYLAKSFQLTNLPATSYATNQACSNAKSLETKKNPELENQNSVTKRSQSLESTTFEEKIRNIYIFNNFTQLNHDIDVDNRIIVNMGCGEESANVWAKYIELKTCSSEEQHSVHTPVAMSQEEFANIKGIF